MINNLGTLLSKLRINFSVLQIDTENSAIGHIINVYIMQTSKVSIFNLSTDGYVRCNYGS